MEDVVGDEVGGEEAGGKLSMLCHSTQRTEMQVSQFHHAEQLHARTFRCGFESGLGQLSLSAHTQIRICNAVSRPDNWTFLIEHYCACVSDDV